MRFYEVLRFQGELQQLVKKYQQRGLTADELVRPASDVCERMALGQPGLAPLSSEEAAELAAAYEEVANL